MDARRSKQRTGRQSDFRISTKITKYEKNEYFKCRRRKWHFCDYDDGRSTWQKM